MVSFLDIVPTGEVWRRADRYFARGYWHWAFLALPAPLPERLIGGDPQAFFDLHVRAGIGLGAEPGRYPPEILDAYRFLAEDEAGFWEEGGYHMRGVPDEWAMPDTEIHSRVRSL